MATRKSSRSMPDRTRSEPRSTVRTVSRAHAGAPDSSERQTGMAGNLRWLIGLTLRLRSIYGTAVAADLALRGQAAEQDAEIADCLRVGVCDPIADEIRDLEGLAQRFREGVTGFNP